MAIGTVEFDLSLVSPETGEYLTARAYTVDGVNNVDGTPRLLSIGQLVMAICLQRATALEASIVALMEEMNATSQQLEEMTEIEQAVVDNFSGDSPTNPFFLNGTLPSGTSYVRFLRDLGILDDTQDRVRNDAVLSGVDILYDTFVTEIESKMDEKNSFSQQKMIELQSQTSKRDQTYDMISNILKSLNTVQVGIVNNY